MQAFTQLESNLYYHIYNHAVGGRNLFQKPDNFEYFLSLYNKYIEPIAETYSWCLMPNHFHLLVRIKEVATTTSTSTSTTTTNPDRVLNPVGDKKNNEQPNVGTPSQQFSKLFNSYAQAYNKYFKTHGALFERPFKRKLIDSDEYLKQVILYIHNNPIHHGFCKEVTDYPWSSYQNWISEKPSILYAEAIPEWFGDVSNFKALHQRNIKTKEINEWLAQLTS